MQGADFASLASSLDQARLLVVGDAMLDRFVAGTVERISPEAPIPILRVERRAEMPGGAGNVVANLLALGARVAFVAVVGDDEAGRVLAGFPDERLERALVVEPGRPTTVKTRFVAGTQQLLRIDEETTTAISPASEDAVLRAVENNLKQAGAVILSDYGKGVLTPRVCQGIIKLARAAKVPVLVDPKGADYTRYDGATAVTPNRRELEQATGRVARHDDEVEAAARSLIAKHHFDALIATRSEQGLSVVRATDAQHIPARAREIFDVSGAGDTVMATLAAAVATGASLTDAAALANAAGGVAVAKPGTATVSRDELVHALELHDETKFLARDGAAGRVETWRRRGLKVAFTNGCFDILHPGHVHLLRQARATADKLIVGLNSDASVKRLKGPARPVNDERARAQVLASLADVDAVVVFEEDTPLQLLDALHPDVLVKGADYTIEQVVGADLVQSYGGKVVLAELVPDQSTTKTIARMAKK
ncbi:D-glycero-beta-D-manno-heptose-7-phosphate kinase [Roseiterribacter gracilis]|uniref:D-glycero-beta-D-manno-heptose-7-phosphate kinase n=1 Tax=Roseiterribacter gracilis TaxID=2812848 RepID=UPI003B436148